MSKASLLTFHLLSCFILSVNLLLDCIELKLVITGKARKLVGRLWNGWNFLMECMFVYRVFITDDNQIMLTVTCLLNNQENFVTNTNILASTSMETVLPHNPRLLLPPPKHKASNSPAIYRFASFNLRHPPKIPEDIRR